MDAAKAKRYDPIDVRQRTCQECGMLLADVGEFHPYVFCVLRQAGLDPWREVRTIAAQLGLGDPGEKPPPITWLVGKP